MVRNISMFFTCSDDALEVDHIDMFREGINFVGFYTPIVPFFPDDRTPFASIFSAPGLWCFDTIMPKVDAQALSFLHSG